jgi:NADPH:quinone reductase-like Zn-dependent oxidoreductase
MKLLPDDVSFEAGAAKNSLTTAWHALSQRAQLQPGEWVLVNAAGSGVGSAGIQVASLIGAKVIASAGASEKLVRALTEGADFVVDYEREDLTARVRELTGGQGVDVVLDCVGGEVFRASVAALAKNGRLVAVGAHSGEIVAVDLVALFRTQLTVTGSLRSTRAELDHVLELLARGTLRPVIEKVLPLESAEEGHRHLEARQGYGKVVLVP